MTLELKFSTEKFSLVVSVEYPDHGRFICSLSDLHRPVGRRGHCFAHRGAKGTESGVSFIVLTIGRQIPDLLSSSIVQCVLILTAVTCWLFWLCCYMAQMNPLIGPKLHQNTILIMAREWGNFSALELESWVHVDH